MGGHRARTGGAVVVAVALLASTSAITAGAYPRPGANLQIDLARDGGQPSCGLTSVACVPSSDFPAISGNGRYVAFHSHASNLVAEDTNLVQDVFVRDVWKKRTIRVSVASDGRQAVGLNTDGSAVTAVSQDPSISASGRYVAFASTAPNLVPNDTNAVQDAFVHDLKTGSTVLASPGPDGGPAGITNGPQISADGRWVVYDALREKVGVGSAGFNQQNVYLYDLHTKKTKLVSRTLDGGPCAGCYGASVSGGGHMVSFVSLDARLVTGDTNGAYDLFVKDMRNGETVRASVASDGSQGRVPASLQLSTIPGLPIMGANGRHVLFASNFPNLVPNDANYGSPFQSGSDVFVHDLHTRRTERVSVSSLGEEGEPGASQHFEGISGNGRHVLFGSSADFDAGAGTAWDLFVHDRRTGETTFVRPTDLDRYNRCGGNGHLGRAGAIGDNGRFVAFRACARTPSDGRSVFNVHRRDMGADVGTVGLQTTSSSGALSPGRTGAVHISDPAGDVDRAAHAGGLDIIGAWVVRRPRLDDLFVSIELDALPPVTAAGLPGVYGLGFTAGGARYELRSLEGPVPGAFGLFECATGGCDSVARLRGGVGTTGPEVVAAIPLRLLESSGRGRIGGLEAFTAPGPGVGLVADRATPRLGR